MYIFGKNVTLLDLVWWFFRGE